MNIQRLRAFSLQLITQKTEKIDEIEGAKIAIDAGCRWVQLRMKDEPKDKVEAMAIQLVDICRSNDAVCIIDDYPDIAQKVGADGVHLGKTDMSVREAREMLGSDFLIGGTCNTFEDVVSVKDYVDYIGCGPFRFTTTKKNLAPVLGLEGYQDIVWNMRESGINIPIVAIGGITTKDVHKIIQSGPNGIAVSGAILNSEDIAAETSKFLKEIEKAF